MQTVRRLTLACLFAVMPAAICQARSASPFPLARSGAPGRLVSWGEAFGGGHEPASGGGYVAACAGDYHSLALKADGTLVAWGENRNGQCNVPRGNDFIAIAAGRYHNLALRSDGAIVAWGDNSRDQCRVPRGDKFLAIAAGTWHSLALRLDGSLDAWGWDDHGQCAVPPGNDYIKVSAGYCHSLALRADGSLVAWGGNGDGQCDVPAGNDFIDIAAGSLHNVALKADGTLVAWGRSEEGQCRVPAGNDFTALAAGCLHNLALRRDGRIVAWGPNSYALAEPPSEGRFALVAAGGFQGLAIQGTPTRPAPVIISRGEVTVVRETEDTSIKQASAVPAEPVQDANGTRAEGVSVAGVEATPDQRPDTPAAPVPKPDVAVSRPDTPDETKTTVAEEPNDTGDRTDISVIDKAVPALPLPVEPVPAVEPNIAPARPDTSGETKTTVAEEPNDTGERIDISVVDKAVPTPALPVEPVPAVEPNVAPARPDASVESKTAPVEKPRDKTPPVTEPNIPINSTDFFRESIAADAEIGADPNAVPVYHFIAQSPVRHFCTINEQEKYKLIDTQSDTWKYAGIAFFAYPEGLQPRGARPVFRFWCPSLWRHFFTMNEAEKKLLTKDFSHLWEYQGVAWYIPPAKPEEKK